MKTKTTKLISILLTLVMLLGLLPTTAFAVEFTPITSVKVSDVTEPVIGATPDFESEGFQKLCKKPVEFETVSAPPAEDKLVEQRFDGELRFAMKETHVEVFKGNAEAVAVHEARKHIEICTARSVVGQAGEIGFCLVFGQAGVHGGRPSGTMQVKSFFLYSIFCERCQ